MTTRMRQLGILLGLLLIAGLCCAQQAEDASQVVAEVGGQKLTVGDLQREQGGKLLQSRYQYYMNQRKALDQLVDDKLIEMEARNRHLTADELLNKVVYKDLKDPTEDQLQVYYEGMESTESYEAVRDSVLQHIRELRREKARAAFVKELRTQARVQILLEPPLIDVKVKDAYAQGAKNSPVTLVEFADYECPYCQRIIPDLQKLEKEYAGRLAVVYKDFPLPMHHTAEKAAEAARCAGEQGKFWEYHDVLFYSKQLQVSDLKTHARVLKLDGDRFDKCLDDGAEAANVKKDSEEAHQIGLTGTPSFFVNGHFFSGAADYTVLKEMVDMQLTLSSQPASRTEVSKTTAESATSGQIPSTGKQE
ncbi:MAG TPA: thioredoxin domain-containing protein [Candidatus Sulfotelmatobacter sp.]|nr:thioredoxin domain-containing protein [Candidatus Sulfotelmatobacter sp.]